MKAIRKFIVGSYAFFGELPGYVPNDYDELHIMDEFIPNQTVLHLFDGKKDVIMVKNMTKEGYILDAVNSGVPMRAGKFLVPEFASYLGMDIMDLQLLDKCFIEMDEKHSYETMIYRFYLMNGGWWLTDKQRLMAFDEYKKKRNY